MDTTVALEEATGMSTHEVQQAMALVRETMDQLAAELSAEANELDGPELLTQQALALPQRAAALRDLSITLRELISLERRQLGLTMGRACSGPTWPCLRMPARSLLPRRAMVDGR